MSKMDVYSAGVLDGATLFGLTTGPTTANFPIALFNTRYTRAFSGAVDPTNALDNTFGVKIGDKYVNTATGNEWTATAVGTGAAVWRHVPRVLAGSAVAVSCPADATEDILATINIAAGAMASNGILRVYALFTVTSSGNSKTLRVRLGGIGGTAFYAVPVTTTVTIDTLLDIQNRGAANSQISRGQNSAPFSQSNTAAQAGAIDTSVATTLVITGQKASAGETLTLESYLVELLRPDIT